VRRAALVGFLLIAAGSQLALAHGTLAPATQRAQQAFLAALEPMDDVDDLGESVRPPDRWMPPSRRGCRGRGERCNPSRRVPVPHGKDAERAAALGLGTDQAGRRLLVDAPAPEVVEAAGEVEPQLLWPVAGGSYGRGVGRTRERRLRHIAHEGVDIVAPAGTPIRAAASGIVAYADNGISGYGNLVMIVHGDGTTTAYAHCAAAYVFAGQRVQQGQIIGTVGATGLARGAHLHFVWRRGARYRDPMDAFADAPRRGVGRGAVAAIDTAR
jgi:murein DD-endopeptidase MepM/ murein hydrolase activator NlpD